jgi:hypothetical protein
MKQIIVATSRSAVAFAFAKMPMAERGRPLAEIDLAVVERSAQSAVPLRFAEESAKSGRALSNLAVGRWCR